MSLRTNFLRVLKGLHFIATHTQKKPDNFSKRGIPFPTLSVWSLKNGLLTTWEQDLQAGEKPPIIITLKGGKKKKKKIFGGIEDSALSCNAASSRAPLAASKLNVNASGIGHYRVSKHIMGSKMRNRFTISDKTIIVQILKHCSQVWSQEMYLVNPALAGCFKAGFKGLKLKL